MDILYQCLLVTGISSFSGVTMRKPHLKHIQIIRLGRFLDMLYRPAEIAEEIGGSQ